MNEPKPIRLICGLGNPGDKYAATRHNAGFWLVDEVARRHGGSWSVNARFQSLDARILVSGQDLLLLKPQNFMNRSGEPLAACMRYFRLAPDEVLVVHDELDLEPGTLRLKFGGGHGGHNGLRDIHRLIGPEYWRLRYPVSSERSVAFNRTPATCWFHPVGRFPLAETVFDVLVTSVSPDTVAVLA